MDKKIPIVFAHGNGESAAHWKLVMDRFRKQGYTQLFAIDFNPPMSGSCVTYAVQLKEFMDKQVLPNIPSGQKVAIFAHSLGVTTTRYYIKNLGGRDHVSHAVLIAGANRGIAGADTALLNDPEGKVFKQAPEINTGGSEFLTKLNTPGGEEDVKYMTLSSPHDYYYAMNELSPFVDWADNRVIPFKGHWGVRDSEESFELSVAFLEGRENSVSIGKALYLHPDRPTGEWNYCADCTKVQRYTFSDDGKVILFDGSSTKQGNYMISTITYPHLIDIQFPEGTYYGLYKLNVNGDGMGMKLGTVNGTRPKDFRYPNLYYKTPRKDGSEKDLAGKWRATDMGFYKAFGTTEYSLQLTAEGKFKLSGKMFIAPNFEAEGRFSSEKVGDVYRLHLIVENSKFVLMCNNVYIGALVALKDGKLLFEQPPVTKNAQRPQVIDNPITLEKCD